MDRVPEVQEERKPSEDSHRSSSDLKSVPSNPEGQSEPVGNFTTTRNRYETDEYGNHLVIGREGEIRKCEDEVNVS